MCTNPSFSGFVKLKNTHTIILKVHLDDSEERCLEFPVNPDSTCEDVLACVNSESGEGSAIITQVYNGQERKVGEYEKLYEILREWEHDSKEVKFYLRHDRSEAQTDENTTNLSSEEYDDYMLEVDGQRNRPRNGMRGPPPRNELPGGVDLTLNELQDMAARQQHQIESQQQVLVAKEQRLKFLKQQEQKQQQISAENERLKKLRDKIESQEMKLKKLRELRGEVEKQQSNNGNLNSELESVKALFTEKEKELVMAVAKVEQLTQQLEEIRKERANQKNGEKSAAAIELEKLKQELMLRNKMNEQQNSKLNAHREMLSKRKEEISRMDNRIHELQQRLKKKKAQQAEQQKQLANQNKGSNRPIGTNIAAIEPYIQYSNKQENGDDIDLKSGFAKQDPKYQTLPTNTKFSLPDMSTIVNKESESKEQNNNNTSNQDQLKIPLSVNVNSAGKNMHNGFSQNQLSDSIIKAAQRHQVVSSTSTNSGHQYAGPPPIPARAATTNLTYFAPRPFGTTYSTNILTNRIQAPITTVNVHEEVRTSGSGQSSPASSEGSQKELPHDMHGPLSIDPLQPTGVPTVYGKNGQESVGDGVKIQKSQDQVDSSQGISSKGVIENGHNTSKDSPPSSHSSGSDNSLNVVNSNTATNITKQPMRYASKNLIANTYMGRLGPEAMKKYQQNFNLIYNGGLSGNQDDKKDSETKNENVSNIPLSPTRHGHQHGLHSPGSPHYTDIASDKVSHNRSTPKTIRRRHSDSENEDMTKLLQKYNVHSSQNQQSGFSFNNMQLETQATSFMDQIPEKVPVDDMGNLVDVQNTDDKQSDSNSSSSISPAQSPTIKIETNKDIVVRRKKTNLKNSNSVKNANRVSFDPLALLLDASLEGELELVKRCASQVANVSESNDEGITALHNAICAGHYDIVTFLVEFGCDVNSPDSDGWTPLHCAASCNNLPMVKFLVEHGACIFATTISDQETAAEKCEEEEEGFDSCSDYLYSIQEKLGILNNGVVYAVFDYEGQHPDELSFSIGNEILVLKKGDEQEKEWWWSKISEKEGYIPRNLIGLYPRVLPQPTSSDS